MEIDPSENIIFGFEAIFDSGQLGLESVNSHRSSRTAMANRLKIILDRFRLSSSLNKSSFVLL
jgi:hypothetical protein